VIARDDIWAVLEKNRSPFKSGHTLNANAVSCAGAIAVIRYILDHNLTENARQRGEQALQGLQQLMENHPIVGDVRGKGLMFGFEFVKDRATKEPFPPEQRISLRFEQAALKRGLVTYPCSGTVNGIAGDMMLLAPPLIITASQMDEMLNILDDSLTELEKELQ
jgi:adenosylmethionine-8-amino-7-oxononanoate aminotransferase